MIGHVCLWLYPEESRVETCYTPMFALLFDILKKVELMFIKHEWMKKMSWYICQYVGAAITKHFMLDNLQAMQILWLLTILTVGTQGQGTSGDDVYEDSYFKDGGFLLHLLLVKRRDILNRFF